MLGVLLRVFFYVCFSTWVFGLWLKKKYTECKRSSQENEEKKQKSSLHFRAKHLCKCHVIFKIKTLIFPAEVFPQINIQNLGLLSKSRQNSLISINLFQSLVKFIEFHRPFQSTLDVFHVRAQKSFAFLRFNHAMH